MEALDLADLDLNALTYDEKVELYDLLQLKQAMKFQNRLKDYAPYPKQKEFHDAGNIKGIVERLLRAGNQNGKTWSAGFETAMHLTGRYPDWWQGKRFDHPTVGWAAGVTGETTRDAAQKILMGRSAADQTVGAHDQVVGWGTGCIPAECIIKIQRKSHGIADAIDYVQVAHVSGGVSMLMFKSYEQGATKFQSETLDFVWFDEEPPMDVYDEGKTRVQAGDEGRGGIVYLTFTPLQGMSEVVKRYLETKAPGTHDTNMTIYDALHYTPEQREAIIAGYLPHLRKARALGIPVLGSGAVFPIDEDLIKEPAFKIPWFWPRIAGVDFGWDHPAAGAWIAWDRETDTVHVYDCYAQSEQIPLYHAAYIKAKGAWIPVAWPHDGYQHGKGDGIEIAEQYRKHGANMLDKHATSDTDGISLEASVGDLLERMQTGRFKVAEHLVQFWSEFRMYYRKDGKIVPMNDDVISAIRYAVMMLRHATTPAPERTYMPSFGVLDDETGY